MRKPISHFLMLLAVVLLGARPLHAQFGWEWQNPLPQGNDLFSVQMIDTSVAVAVGYYGTILRTVNGGTNWKRQQGNVFGIDYLRGVSFTDPQSGTAIGPYGKIIRTDDGGATWINQINPAPFTSLKAVQFTSVVTGTAVGNVGTILRTTNSGETWTRQPTGLNVVLDALAFIDFATGVVVGEQGIILYTNDGGATWTRQYTGNSSGLYGVAIAGANTIVAVGDSGVILHSTNAGVTWTQQQCYSNAGLNAVTLINNQVGFIVGDFGSVFKTTDGGDNWIAQSTNTSADIFSVSFANDEIGMIVGRDGLIEKTTNGGSTWLFQTSGPTCHLLSTSFVSSTNGYAVGDSNMVMHTTNGGAAWNAITPRLPRLLRTVCFVDSTTGWIGGQPTSILKTTDAGSTWTEQLSTGQGHYIKSISFATALRGIASSADTIYYTYDGGKNWFVSADLGGYWFGQGAVAMLDSLNAVAVGKRDTSSVILFLLSTDGGRSWADRAPIAPIANGGNVSFFNDRIGLINTTNGFFRTTDGGNSWSLCNSVYTDAAGISMVDARHAFAINGTEEILKTTDCGNTWQQLKFRAPNMMGISAHSRNDVTIVGMHGTILHTSTGGIYTPLSVSIDEHDFGNVPVNTSASVIATIKNVSAQTVTVSPGLTGDSVFTCPADSIVLAPGASQSLTMSFNPVVPWHRGALITLRHNGNAVDTDLIGLEGVGVGPQSQLSRSLVDLGDIFRGSTRSDCILIYNTGNAPLEILGMSTSDRHVELRLSSSIVAPGDSSTMTISYTPDSFGAFFDSVFIDCASPAQSQVLLLRGQGLVQDFVVVQSSHSIDFANVKVDSTRMLPIVVVNPTNFPSSIDSIVSSDRHFVVAHSFTFNPNEDLATIPVSFRPDSLGLFTGWVSLYHKYNAPPDSVFVHGNGVELVSVFDASTSSPDRPTLFSAYPNPFEANNTTTSIAFSLPTRSDVSLNIFSPIGELVALLAQGSFDTGVHVVKWNAETVPAGIYFYRLTCGGVVESKSVIVVR